MRMWLIPLSCACLFSAGAPAQEPPVAHGLTVRQACEPDVQKFCEGVQPGGGRIKACMAQHKNELSQPCRDALKSARAQHQDDKSNNPPASNGPSSNGPSNGGANGKGEQ
jgi:Cysteine rich repeat